MINMPLWKVLTHRPISNPISITNPFFIPNLISTPISIPNLISTIVSLPLSLTLSLPLTVEDDQYAFVEGTYPYLYP